MKVKVESEKVGLKLNIQKTKIMASGPITSWQIDGETMETVADYFWGLQNHCRWWLQPWNWKMLTPWNDQPRQLIKKQKHYCADKGPYSQRYDFSNSHVWMCELDYKESWAPKNWCFWIVVLEKTLESPLDARTSNQSIQKEISTECSLEGLMLKLKLQYFGHLMRKTDSLEKPWCWERLKVVEEGDDKGWDVWMASLMGWTRILVGSGSWW